MKKALKNLAVFCILAIIIAGIILPRELNNLDEIWNFNFARNIANGLVPYKDFNMLQTPLLSIVCGCVLQLLGQQLIVMRVLAVILCAGIIFLLYKILTTLKINEFIAIILLFPIMYMYKDYFTIDYNYANILITLLITLLELKYYNKESKIKDILFGILAGLAILNKQTTGFVLALIFVFYKLLIIDKSNAKTILKSILYRVIGVIIPVGVGFAYLVYNNALYDFLDYTVLGIKTFNNFIPYTNLLIDSKLYIKIIAIIIPIIIITMYIISIVKKQEDEFSKKIFILFAYSIAEMIVVFPISTFGYLIMGMINTYIGLIFILAELIKKMKFKKTKLFLLYFFEAITVMLTLHLMITSITKIKEYVKEAKQYNKVNHYRFIECDEQNIKLIDEFVLDKEKEQQKVYILDASAALYMIPIDRYNKNYDMFLKGNLGAKGEEGQIENLKKEEDIMVLIINDKYARNWQNPEKVREYIIDEWNKVGEISKFDIYEKK